MNVVDNNEIINQPIDFILWIAFFKKKKDTITKYMKAFQLFCLFQKYKPLGHFKPYFYGANDNNLISQIYLCDGDYIFLEEDILTEDRDEEYTDNDDSPYFFFQDENEEYIYEKNKDRISRRISLNKEISEKLMKVYSSNKELYKDDFRLLEIIAELTDKYKLKEFIAFLYKIDPEMTKNSVIAADILKIPENKIREIANYFIEKLPPSYCVEFINNLLDTLLLISLIEKDLKESLKMIIHGLISRNTNKEILRAIKNDLIHILNNELYENYKLILRNFLDYLINNENILLTNEQRCFFIRYVLFLKRYTQEDILKFYDSERYLKINNRLLGATN